MKKSNSKIRWLTILVSVPILIYVSILVRFFINQDKLLFQNQRVVQQPNIEKLDIQDIRIKTSDGEIIQAWYEPARPNRPTVLFFHGNATLLEMSKWRYLRMHKQGVGYLAIAYRGYGESSGTPSEAGILTDGIAAYEWLVAQRIRPENIIIHGHSLGTGVATHVASLKPARALLLEAPFLSAPEVAKAHYPYLPIDLMMRNRFENKRRIHKVKMPLLIAHGTGDVVIPFSQGRSLFAMANSPKKFVEMKNSDHNTLTRDGVYDHYWRFIGLVPMDFAPNIIIGAQ